MAIPAFVAAVMWPTAKKAAAQLILLVATNKELQKRFGALMGQLADIKKARTPEARISRAMATVREQGQNILDQEARTGDSLASVQAASWMQRADQVERALKIVEHQPKAARKTQLPRVEKMADALLGEMLTSLMDDVGAEAIEVQEIPTD